MRHPEFEPGGSRRGPYLAVVLDRQPLWLNAVTDVLERAGFQVVGATTSETRALELIREHRPDVLIFEPEAITSSASPLFEAARSLQPNFKAVAVSSNEEAAVIRAVLQAGAWAYVLKRAHPEDIAVAVRQAFAHSIHLAGTVGANEQPSAPTNAFDDARLSRLTKREREILALVAEGHSNSTMARMLWVTEQTVKFHLSNIYRKLDVPNRTAATRWAHDTGLVDRPH